MFHRKHNQAGEYTDVPAGAGGTANYPGGQSAGYGYEAGKDVNVKSGYGTGGSGMAQHSGGYGGGPYVQHQPTPVTYGPAGQPVEAYPRKKSNRAANWCAAAFVACWACTWPCHGPCCCGL